MTPNLKSHSDNITGAWYTQEIFLVSRLKSQTNQNNADKNATSTDAVCPFKILRWKSFLTKWLMKPNLKSHSESMTGTSYTHEISLGSSLKQIKTMLTNMLPVQKQYALL